MDHFLNVLREKRVLISTHRHLLILDEEKAHLTLDVLTKTKRNGKYMLTISFHTCHSLHPLNVACFESFKVASRTYNQAWNVRIYHGSKVKKKNLASWIYLTFKKTMTNSNIRA